MKKLDDLIIQVLILQMVINGFATVMSLASGSSVNGWNVVIAVNLLVMALVLVGRLVVSRVVKHGKGF